jgi:predicted metal-dependent phosphoesterase TrpH
MAAHAPFTRLCQSLARPSGLDRADLHLHTTFSDGAYTPAQVVDLARRAGLSAIAITDHDTLEGIAPTRRAAEGTGIEVIAGVEITAELDGRELHLLGYFVSADAGPLADALARLRQQRRHRFLEMVALLRHQGIDIPEEDLPPEPADERSLGRRHLAEVLVRRGVVPNLREAFQRYLRDGGRAEVPKQRLPVAEAIACVRDAGGVSSWAHPPEGCGRGELLRLRDLGLSAVEAVYPGFRDGRRQNLRALARELNLRVTGGSDCHGPDAPRRTVGACTISREEVEALRPIRQDP